MTRGVSTKGLSDKRRGLDYKLKRRAALNVQHGQVAGWASEALDAYLGGLSNSDIAKVFEVTTNAVAMAIAKEALFRLMAQKQAERLDQMNLRSTS